MRYIKSRILRMVGVAVFAAISFLIFPKQSALAVALPPTSVGITPGPGSGQAMLNWSQFGTVAKYSLVFGTESGNYTMGLPSIPADSRGLTVNSLVPGKMYFFQLWSYDDPNGPATHSVEVSAVAK